MRGEAYFILDIIGQKCYTLSMKQKVFNNRQTELAIALREATKAPEDEQSWGNFTDFTRAIAALIEGAETLARPADMHGLFSEAWKASAKLWTTENNRIIQSCLGDEYERVMNHPNGRNVKGRILSRVKEVHGNLTPGMIVDDVDVDDILLDELGDER